MENYGCRVYAFDHNSLKELGDHQHSPKIKFYLMGLSNRDVTAIVAIGDVFTETSRLGTLSNIYNTLVPEHGEKMIDYLKIEPEFEGDDDEWGIVLNLLDSGILKKVRQMEILVRYDPKLSKKQKQNQTLIIKSLESTGFVRFSSVRMRLDILLTYLTLTSILLFSYHGTIVS